MTTPFKEMALRLLQELPTSQYGPRLANAVKSLSELPSTQVTVVTYPYVGPCPRYGVKTWIKDRQMNEQPRKRPHA